MAWNAPCTRIRVAGSRGSELPSQVKVPTTRFLSAPFAGDFAPGLVIVGRPHLEWTPGEVCLDLTRRKEDGRDCTRMP